MENLIEELKTEIIDLFGLSDVEPKDIDENAPFIGGELGIDSIDALELIITIEKKYGVKIPNPKIGREVFSSVANMAKYILENKK